MARRRAARILVALGFAAGLVLAACGDDDAGGSDSGSSSGAGVTAFCDYSAELGEVVEPTDEQLDRIVSLAPAEIRGAVEAVVEAFRGDPDLEELRNDPELLAAAEQIAEFERENCDGE